ncbi:MAG: hypothetical protein AAF242_12845 [Bacteroidota bacterium]
MKNTSLFVIAIMMIVITSCNQEPAQTTTEETVAETNLAKVPADWIDARVAAAKSKLEATEAGQIVWKAMEAHGGLDKWYANGPISFRFNYQPLDGSTQRDTYETVDTWRNRTRHQDAADQSAEYGFDGGKFWEMTQDSAHFAYNVRFWSLTPYYFMAQPFILDGAGVNLEKLPQKQYKDQTHDVVKVTFDAGTGDAPDDYYILHFNAENSQLEVIRYIVSYPGYFEKGKHLPEKFMELYGSQTVNGIILPEYYQTHWLNESEGPGEYITRIDLTDVKFQPEVEDGYFAMPQEAKELKSL